MTDTAPTIYRRTTIDGEATLSGLLDIVAKISQVAPQSAEIVQVAVAALEDVRTGQIIIPRPAPKKRWWQRG